MDDMTAHTIVSTDWLDQNLGSPGLRVLDASWYLPATGRDAWREYLTAHIPGAVFFDLDVLSDHQTSLPHTLPPPEQFARAVGALGIGDSHQVVVYDGSGANVSAGRAWWMFRVYGHPEVAVLDGGFKKWCAEGRAVEPDAITPLPVSFTPRFDPAMVRSLSDLLENLADPGTQVVDARSSGRFQGVEPEPRPGLRPGHIPGSRNVPYTSLVRPDGTLLPPEELRSRFTEAGVDLTLPIVTTCGSGVTACDLLLALDVLGHRYHTLYDGSWSEWGGHPDTPVARGPG
jgi:thiosulfate/3-mercaptopyruvate sulfurtransferase